jgi:FKBP-type peptidyl-prolyl cis-trans isomerase SlyD
MGFSTVLWWFDPYYCKVAVSARFRRLLSVSLWRVINMNVSDEKAVWIEYVLKDTNGEVLDSTEEIGAMPYIHGEGDIMPGLEDALEGCAIGDKIDVTIDADDAFGEVDETLIESAPVDEFKGIKDLSPGMQIEVKFEDEEGEDIMLATIVSITDGQVVYDLNHPFAGKTLQCEVEVKKVRNATEEELDLGRIME